jgi:DNA processing protein
VVEAGEGSGALSTVDFALQMGHEVLCYPGPVDCVASRGSNRLLREGALLVRHAADVLESMGWEATAAARTAPLGLGDRPETAEEIARRRGHPVSQVLTELVLAEEAGTVERCPGGRWRVTP